MNPRKIAIAAMEQNGFEFKRHDFNENDMRYIFKEAGIQSKKKG